VASYTQAIAAKAWAIMAACYNFEGVAPSYLNALVGSVPGVNTARIGTGGAVVDGQWYKNDAAYDVTIPSAVGGGNTRIDRVVLRVTWASFQCVITRIAGTDAASPVAPAITQTPGTTYDILLYQALVNTGGTVTLTDERVFSKISTADGLASDVVTTAKILNDAVTTAKILNANVTHAKLADDAVETHNVLNQNITLPKMAINSIDSDQYIDASIDYEHLAVAASKITNRQGGNAYNWSLTGVNNYALTQCRVQIGAAITDGSGHCTLTFPVAFGDLPLALCTPFMAISSVVVVRVITATQLTVYSYTPSTGAALGSVEFYWIAIGPAT
jgi:BarA-like signal transduction histidine kinase